MKAINSKSLTLSICALGSSCWIQAQTPEPKARTLKTGLKLHELREDAATPDLGVYDSYAEAQQLEKEIVQMYTEIRAAQLSLIQQQTLERSLDSTITPLSKRADVDKQLLTEKAKDAESVKGYQKELGVVIQETDAIVANANALLASFMKEPPPPPEVATETIQEPLTPEEIANQVTQPETETQISDSQPPPPPSSQAMAELKEQQEQLQKEIEQNVEEVEINLEDALQEIEAAKELVEEKVEETQEKVEETETELAKEEEKPETEKEPEKIAELKETLKEVKEEEAELKELEEKVETAKEVVEAVVAELKEVTEAPEEQIEKAEEVIKELREALAAVMEADEAVPEVAEQEATKEHTEKAVEKVETAQAAMDAAAEAMAEMQAMAQMLALMESGESAAEDNTIAQIQTLEVYSRAAAGKWIDLTAQMRGKNLNAKPVEVPADQRPALWDGKEAMNVAPSVKKVINTGGKGGDWFFIGDWYVLSRYDNANRANLQKVYPPESILDIDAHYLSEDGKPMQWEYESFIPPRIKPYGWEAWKIYYFYTELNFEEETEAWLAIGSDDRSDIWINDLPIWHSANHHKNWNPYEGFRKVVFKKGRNKVLVRLENGHHGLGFSMFMKLPPK